MSYDTRQRILLALGGALLLSSAARAQDTTQPPVAAAVADPIPSKPGPKPAMCPPPDGTRPDATLVNTDAFVLERFPLSRVYEQLIALAGATSPTATELYQQMWDALDTSANAKFKGPHCDDDKSTINGFPIDCPRPETILKDTDPSLFTPVALFNRFDLSSSDGAICGEYRIIYALKTPDVAGREFIIFEGILPNPTPACGIETCRPVVEFWENLAALDPNTPRGQQALAGGLEQFYFKGLRGFEPVVHPNHYGATGGGGYGQRSGGQIRTNMFVDFDEWQLREFHLVTQCDLAANGCRLVLDPVTVKTNPFHEMFNISNPAPDPRAGAFRSMFPGQSLALSNDKINQISMGVDDRFNAGQSTSQDVAEHYERQFDLGAPPNTFSDAIKTELGAIMRTDLTPNDITRRATTQSCAGCHQLSNGAALGGKLNPTWPRSRGFVHVDESGFLSQALWCEFLPARKAILDGFFASAPEICDPTKPVRPVVVLDSTQSLNALPPVQPGGLTVAGKITGPN